MTRRPRLRRLRSAAVAPTRLTMSNGISFVWPIERPHFAIVTSVTDGDTIRVDLDQNFKDWKKDYPIRFYGCNAWDTVRAADGYTPEQVAAAKEAKAAAKANLAKRLPVGTQVVLTMIRDYKYGGEFVGKVWLLDGTNLIDELIGQQWLAEWDGEGKRDDHVPPWPRTVP